MGKENKIQMEIEVNDENFEEKVIKQSKKILVVVDFWAEWCKPCLMLAPVLEKIAEEYKGKFILVKANIKEARNTAEKYGVMSIPNVKFFREGKVIDEFVGVYPEAFVSEWVKKNL